MSVFWGKPSYLGDHSIIVKYPFIYSARSLMKSVSKVITGGVFAAIFFLSLGITSEGEVGEVLRGRAVFVKNCVACHSINAKGNVVGVRVMVGSNLLLRV